MTYLILDYSMNEPSTKRITVPLRSSYGVGIRVSENGQALSVDPNQIAVNGISATTKMFDVHLCNLSSGTEPCLKAYDVTVNGQPAPKLISALQTGYTNELDKPATGIYFPMSFNPPLQLPISIEASLNSVGRITVSADGEIYEDTSPILVAVADLFGFKNYVVSSELWIDTDTSEPIGSVLTVSAGYDVGFDMHYDVPAKSSVSADYTLTIESERNAHDATFKLVVNENDLGYFDI